MKRGIDGHVDHDRITRDVFALFSDMCVVVVRIIDFGNTLSITCAIELDFPKHELHAAENKVTIRSDNKIGSQTISGSRYRRIRSKGQLNGMAV
jgi:hypothetical protein